MEPSTKGRRMRTCNTLAPQLGTGHPVPLADTPAGLSDHSKHPLSSRAWLEVLHRDGIHLAWGAPGSEQPSSKAVQCPTVHLLGKGALPGRIFLTKLHVRDSDLHHSKRQSHRSRAPQSLVEIVPLLFCLGLRRPSPRWWLIIAVKVRSSCLSWWA